MTDEACEAMCELVWTARLHAVSAACALQTALDASACGKTLGKAMGSSEVAADSALESLIACVDRLRKACDLI